jgi:hypothetical protein
VTVTITAADVRDSMDSRQVHIAVEGPVEREDGGFCYCHPASSGDPERGERFPLHFHLRISGSDPEASPRYYELPVW